ncbi:MAG TPA: hypothetical protein VHL13_03840 [Pseudolabrys sp.]|nr:hypothetical protein [Pseudolabrys sp.]
MNAQPGILAIWNDVTPGREADFDAWFQGEHLVERLGVPGFRFGRRHEAVSGAPRFFVFYVTDGPEVLTSKPYLERLDNPTPMTRMIMSDVFKNMNRTLCRRVARRGDFRGSHAVTVRFNEAVDEAALTRRMDELAKDHAVAAAELWIAADAGAPVSMEEKLRGGDKKIKACLMVDTLRQQPAEALGARLAKDFPQAEVGVYRVLCQLGQGMGM